MIKQACFSIACCLFSLFSAAQLQWTNVDSLYGPLPASVHVYYTEQSVDSTPFRAFYVVADLRAKHLDFTTDTTLDRRLTPSEFFEKNNKPLVVVNGTFFSFETNRNLNVVIKNGQLLAHNPTSFRGRGKDSVYRFYAFKSAIGIDKKRRADVAWLYTGFDSCCLSTQALAHQYPVLPTNLSLSKVDAMEYRLSKRFDTVLTPVVARQGENTTWKVETAIGGGPVLVQQGKVAITNQEENMFVGKAIHDKHPRTAMGYTADNKLIILVIEGRNKQASGASLIQEAQILKNLGCIEALNLDGGGSSCLLVNGKETIKPSDPKGQRPVPAVFMIRKK